MSVAALEQAIFAVAPDALLVDPRIMRRVIWFDRRLTGLGLRVPHDKTYTIESARLLAYVDRSELDAEAVLAPTMILLSRPAEQDAEYLLSPTKLLRRYWQRLFHARVHLAIESVYPAVDERQAVAAERRRQIGEVEFAEIRSVLLQDRFLFQEHNDWDVYVEFAAVSLDRKYFVPDDRAYSFPAITDWTFVDEILSQDVRHAEIYSATRLLPEGHEPSDDGIAISAPRRRQFGRIARDATRDNTGAIDKWQARAKRSARQGNHMKAAVYWRLAAKGAKGKNAENFHLSALSELKTLIHQLRQALQQEESSTAEWVAGLSPVLDLAVRSIWSAEARLLYDLQKICVESESESRRASLVQWITSLGRQPLTRPLPLLQQVLMAKHIRSAQKRIAKTYLSDSDRQRVSELLACADERAEWLLRSTLQPLINQELDHVGLVPENIPERVARNKLVEEMLDNLVEYGYMTSSTFRDALSKGDLKLRDVSVQELVMGDQFLRADRRLSITLDGVYRPAPVYLRWSQRLSSLVFGTRIGRNLTLHLALPFGGAFLIVEGVRHVIAWLAGGSHGGPTEQIIGLVDESASESAMTDTLADGRGEIYFSASLVVFTGIFIYLLMHRPLFRTACGSLLLWTFRWTRTIFIDWPARLLRIRLIEQILYSPDYAPLRTYLIKPGLLAAGLLFLAKPFLPSVDLRIGLELFLLLALFLNSPVGRYADEWFTDLVLRTVEDLRARVFGALFQWIMDIFQRLLIGLDRILHTLDEWSRFRTRDSRLVKLGKFVTGSLWAVIAYFIVLVSTLLIEPQINPIKHFPVVTVSHKFLLPLGPYVVVKLSPFIGTAQANTLVWSTIWLIPGVFGFLVWELRGNWRLYAANRPEALQPQSVGHHGETMLALLRPTIHSGTLPKLFARLRRAMRRTQKTGEKKSLTRQQTILKSAHRQVKHFVERELIELLIQSQTVNRMMLSVHIVRLATNRVQVALQHVSAPESLLWISWQEFDKRLGANIEDNGLFAIMPADQRYGFALALAGLLQRTGVEEVRGTVQSGMEAPLTWDSWVTLWSSR